jgi:uncharacterized membrane protein YdfJ with MMPL/SSD domain
LATLRSLTVSNEELQAAKNTFLVNHSEALQSGALVAETLAGNAMSGVESASEMINMISTSDINVSLENSIIQNFSSFMDMLGHNSVITVVELEQGIELLKLG